MVKQRGKTTSIIENGNAQMPSFRLGSWQMLPSEGGQWLAWAGERMAVAGQARLVVWHGQAQIVAVDAPSPAPGVPRFVGDRVYWGPGAVDLVSGRYAYLEPAQPAVWPGGGERPHVYAWSPQGDRFLGSFSSGDPLHPVRVTLFDGRTGVVLATLWKGAGLPPEAAWFGEEVAVVGFGNPKVFDLSGRSVADIALGGSTVVALGATGDGGRLVAVDSNRSISWIDAATWSVLDQWPGPWLSGAVSPDGRFVVALEPWGKLHLACMVRDRFAPLGQVAVDEKAVTVAVGPDQVGTVGGGQVGRASLRVDCSQVGRQEPP
jgi:hypothetical protein